MATQNEGQGGRAAKRRKIVEDRIQEAKSHWRKRRSGFQPDPATTYIFRLPLELLAESLSHLLPIDILALARTCKYFCNTLTEKNAIFIWKRARELFPTSPIPDPPCTWSEPALAAFLFDRRLCATCHERVRGPIVSFAFRFALCGKPACSEKYSRNLVQVTVLPTEEANRISNSLLYLDCPNVYDDLGGQTRRHSKAEHERERLAYYQNTARGEGEEKQKYLDDLAARTKRATIVMGWTALMQTWCTAYMNHERACADYTKSTITQVTVQRGWIVPNLGSSQTLVSLQRRYARMASQLPRNELAALIPTIEEELGQARSTAEAREHNKDKDVIASFIKGLYHKFNNEGEGLAILPTFSEFERLPVITMLRKCNATAIEAANKSNALQKLVDDNLRVWVKDTKDQFGALLGHKQWAEISSKVLHPAERVTSYFECAKCYSVSKKNAISGTLTFAEACRHAASIAKEALLQARGNAEFDTLKVMDFRSLLGHCKRHDLMELTLIAPTVVNSILRHPIEYGLFQKLKHERNRTESGEVHYGCRLCGQFSKGKFMFNGLVSHVAAKHGIQTMRDEDFFEVREGADNNCTTRIGQINNDTLIV